MARRDRTQSETMPGVRSGTPRDALLSGVDSVWKSGGGSLSKSMTLKPFSARRRSVAASGTSERSTSSSAIQKR